MKLDIVTPDGALFSGEVTSIVVPGVNGAFEMLNNHAPDRCHFTSRNGTY